MPELHTAPALSRFAAFFLYYYLSVILIVFTIQCFLQSVFFFNPSQKVYNLCSAVTRLSLCCDLPPLLCTEC